MKYNIYIFLLIFFLPSLRLYAQDTLMLNYDTAYIEDLSDQLAVRIYGINKFNRFSIRDTELDHEIQYSPNNNLNLGFGVNYKWFGLGIAFNLPFINNDDEKYGNTTRFDAQTNITTRKYLIDIYLQQYKGFYIENPESYIDDWDGTLNYPQRPDVSTSTIGGSFTYIFNYDKYSAKAAFVQNEVQKRSAGSFLIGGFFSLFTLEGDSSLVPHELSGIYNPDLFFKRVSSNNFGVAGGYTHNFVMWKKLCLSISLVPGVAVQTYRVDYESPKEQIHGSRLSGRFLVRGALVYNSKKSFAGITGNNDTFSGTSGSGNSNSLNFEVGVVRFFYGRRIMIRR